MDSVEGFLHATMSYTSFQYRDVTIDGLLCYTNGSCVNNLYLPWCYSFQADCDYVSLLQCIHVTISM